MGRAVISKRHAAEHVQSRAHDVRIVGRRARVRSLSSAYVVCRASRAPAHATLRLHGGRESQCR